jgi:hypothetical protein
MIEFDVNSPLTRCKGEPKTANAALYDYFSMGPGRSLRGLFTNYLDQSANKSLTNVPPTRYLSTISTWSTKFSWVSRVARQEEIDRQKTAQMRADALQAQLNLWSERQFSVRERDWNQGEEIRNLFEKMIKEAPNYIKQSRRTIKGKGGNPDTVIIHEKLDIKLMISALSTASTIQRLAAEMETDHNLNELTTPENLDEVRKKRWAEIAPRLFEAISDDKENIDEQGENDRA